MMVRYRFNIVCLLAASLFVFTCAAGVQAAKQSEKAGSGVPGKQGQPVIYIPQFSYDFGEMMEGADAAHDFTVKNTGAGVLNIDRVVTS